MTWTAFALRAGCAALFGLVIGAERQLTGHSAGIRINVLVCVGSCMFALFPMVADSGDITRIAAQIVSGVGFLCSGIIFKDGVSVRGLNTAATIWCTAAIGVLSSSGRVSVAGTATAFLLAANLLFRPLAGFVRPLDRFDESEHQYLLSVTCRQEQEFGIRGLLLHALRECRLMVTNLESSDVIGGGVEIEATLLCRGRRRDETAEALVAKIGAEEGISAAGWKYLE